MDECPYGADDCPKICELKELMDDNRNRMTALENKVSDLDKSVVELKTTIRNYSKFVSVLTSVLGILIGLVV